LAEIRDYLKGKIVVDVTNPVKRDLSGLTTEAVSAAEIIQGEAPMARVVKAFNTVLAANQANPIVDGIQLDGYVAADDAPAKTTMLDLLTDIGYRRVDAGPLASARYLEAMAFLNIWLNASNGGTGEPAGSCYDRLSDAAGRSGSPTPSLPPSSAGRGRFCGVHSWSDTRGKRGVLRCALGRAASAHPEAPLTRTVLPSPARAPSLWVTADSQATGR
jgi:hypothetical protein